jgi:hypothetical protein
MFGTAKVKFHGLRHVYVYYFGVPPAPENIRLHGAVLRRRPVHTADPATLPAVKSNALSCVSSGCHDVIHDVVHLKDAKLWKETH